MVGSSWWILWVWVIWEKARQSPSAIQINFSNIVIDFADIFRLTQTHIITSYMHRDGPSNGLHRGWVFLFPSKVVLINFI